MLLLFYQGSYAPFADVPILVQGGVPRHVKRKGAERGGNPDLTVIARLERELAQAQARAGRSVALLQTLDRRAIETTARATQTRRVNALAKQRSLVAEIATQIKTLNAAMAVEVLREEEDLIFVFTILSEV